MQTNETKHDLKLVSGASEEIENQEGRDVDDLADRAQAAQQCDEEQRVVQLAIDDRQVQEESK